MRKGDGGWAGGREGEGTEGRRGRKNCADNLCNELNTTREVRDANAGGWWGREEGGWP